MALAPYLALTREEIRENITPPHRMAWLSRDQEDWKLCPPGAMLVLTDEVRPAPESLAEAAQALAWESILLDFQTPATPERRGWAEQLAQLARCPVGMPAGYAPDGYSPLFLPPIPVDIPPEEYLAPWQGREVWLELALDGKRITVTARGARQEVLLHYGGPGLHRDERLCCHYALELGEDAVFTLGRTREDLELLLEKAEAMGLRRAIGLHQELMGWE